MGDLQKRIANLSPERQALLTLLAKRKGLNAPEAGTIPKRKGGGPVPLSFSQQRLWFLDQLMPDSAQYNEPLLALRLTGELDSDALQWTINEIVRRHESLRTVFQDIDGEPVQLINPPAPVPLTLVDLRHLPAGPREAEMRRLALQESQHVFNLARGPLLRFTLIRMDEAEHVILLEIHHIVTDGWSNRILMSEVTELYRAFINGRPSPLPELPVQYADFAVWQKQWLQGEVLENLLAYWKRQLGHNLPVLKLPTDHARPQSQTFNGASQDVLLPQKLCDELKALAQSENATLFMILLAAFMTLLYRYTGQEDMAIGSPVANRSRSETEKLIGFFVNTLVLRADLSGNPKFSDFLSRVREVATGAFSHQDLPFEKLVEVLQPERDLSRQALFQVLFVLHNYPHVNLDIEGRSGAGATAQSSEQMKSLLRISGIEVENDISKFDLALAMSELGEKGLKAQIDYNTDLFEAATITRMLGHFKTLLCSITAQPSTRLNALKIFSDAGSQPEVLKKQQDEESFLMRLKKVKRETVNLKKG
jgi:hypothetical protein